MVRKLLPAKPKTCQIVFKILLEKQLTASLKMFIANSYKILLDLAANTSVAILL